MHACYTFLASKPRPLTARGVTGSRSEPTEGRAWRKTVGAEGMSELEWLVVLEDTACSRRDGDRYVDAHDWNAYEALRHRTMCRRTTGLEPWLSSKEMIENVSRMMNDTMMVHHSYDPEIIFDSPTKARRIWAMSAVAVAKNGDQATWTHVYGYYYETYEKREGGWMFTTRRWHKYFRNSSDGVHFPKATPKGSNVFEDGNFGYN